MKYLLISFLTTITLYEIDAQEIFSIYSCDSNLTSEEEGLTMIKAGRTAFENNDDHDVLLEVCWSEKELRFKVVWMDNIIDTSEIIRDSIRWTHASGNYRGDRMYFYDNITFRLFYNDTYYEAWISPENPPRMQWETIEDGLTILPSDNPGEFTAVIDLDKIELIAQEGTQLDISIVAPDADMPEATLVEKFSKIKYQHFRRTFVLS